MATPTNPAATLRAAIKAQAAAKAAPPETPKARRTRQDREAATETAAWTRAGYIRGRYGWREDFGGDR